MAADTQHATFRERMRATLYLPVLQDAGVRERAMFVRTASDPKAMTPTISCGDTKTDPALPIMGVTTLHAATDRALVRTP